MITQSDFDYARAHPETRQAFLDGLHPRYAKDIARLRYMPELVVSDTIASYAKSGTTIYTSMRIEHDTKVALPLFIVGKPSVSVFAASFAPEVYGFADDFLSSLEHERIHAERRCHSLAKLEYILKTEHDGDTETARMLISLVKAVDEIEVYDEQFERLDNNKRYSKDFIMNTLESQAAQKRKRDDRTTQLRTMNALSGEAVTLETLTEAVRRSTGMNPADYNVVHHVPQRRCARKRGNV